MSKPDVLAPAAFEQLAPRIVAYANLHAGVTGAPLRTPVPECAAR